MTKDDINWLVNLVDERKKFAEACRMCSECDIFDKCQEEHRNYCEKDEENIMKENNENDLISRRTLYEKCVELEQEALKMVLTTDDKIEKLIWNAVLTERSAFKFSVMDAPASLSNPSVEIEPKWIPVTERLPKKESKSYWVCTDTKYQCECRWTNNIYGIGESDKWGWKIFDIPQYTKVVAWMPLPPSYQGK